MTIHWEIGVSASFTADAIARFERFTRPGFEDITCTFRFAPIGQIERACFQPLETFGSQPLSAVVLLWRIEDFVDALPTSVWTDIGRLTSTIMEKVEQLADAATTLASKSDSTIILSLPAMPQLPGQAADMPLPVAELETMFLQCRSRLREAVSSSPTIKLLDLDALVRQAGTGSAYDHRKWYLYRQPFSDKFLRTLTFHIQRLLAAGTIPSKKCIVIDCDNTIWGGVIDEDGLSGIQLGDSFPGRAFLDIQREIVALRNRGIFVAVASKNDLPAVLEVFDKHDGMILKRSDISVFEVNWGRKSESLEKIAQKLNIGIDSLVLLDDNPAEIAEVNSNLPEVATILLPTELTAAAEAIRNCSFFDTWRATREDAIRVGSSEAEARRESVRVKSSPEQYLADLGICVSFFRVGEKHIDRVCQLINKTNQFNLTTRRRTLAEVRELHRSSSHQIFAYDVRDRFGEYGLVGVMITRQDGSVAELDTWLMSCRVLNRGVEAAAMYGLHDRLSSDSVELIRADYIPTAKNSMVSGLLQQCGFVQSNNRWEAKVAEGAVSLPKHLRLDHPDRR